MKNLRARIDGS